MTGTPTARNGAVSRVATVNPYTAGMVAICPSATEIAKPLAIARLTSKA
jgi:ammonia channel protein AmtB